MGGIGVGMMLPGLMMGPMMGMGLGMGMGGCCDDILGPQGRGALGGSLLGGLAGGLLGGPGGAIGGMLGGGILGGILGGRQHRHCHHNHGQQFPPPYGGGCGGAGYGGYGGGGYPGGGFGGDPFGGGGFGGGGMANQAAMMQMMLAQQQQQQMYGGGGGFPGGGFGGDPFGGGFGGGGFGGGIGGGGNPYQQGYNAGQYAAGFQQGYQQGGNPYGQGQYFGNNYGCNPGGCQPQGYGYNGGCCGPQHCMPGSTGNPGGQLEQCGGDGKPINYRTSGGYNVSINGDKVIITDPTGKQKIEHSGDPHEYVNGKHIKDWEGKDRSLILPDGTKITMNASGPQGVVQHTSIYDGDQNVQINNQNNQIEHQSYNPYDTRSREAYQADGETSAIRTSRDGNKLSYDNLYTQDQNLGVRNNYKHLAGDQGPWYQRPFFGLFGGPRTHDAYNDPRLLFT